MPRIAKDLKGQRFAKLIVKERIPGSKGEVRWLCVCDCGNTTEALSNNLIGKRTGSCGCTWKEIMSSQDGLTDAPEYASYKSMMSRCYRDKDESYPRYGAKGITVCDEWKGNFKAFLRDMGPRPSSEHTVDRIKNDKGYSKENCRWATKEEQANNRISNVNYTLNGITKTLMQWCRDYNIDYSLAVNRVKRGWLIEDALTKQPAFVGARVELIGSKKITYDGVTKSLKDWCDLLDLNKKEIYLRIIDGDNFEDIVKDY